MHFVVADKRGGDRKDGGLLVVPKPKRVGTALSRPTLGNVNVMKVTEVLYKVVSPRETLVAHPRAVLHSARVPGSTDAVHCGLVPLQVGQAGEVGCRGTVGKIAFPCSNHLVSA
jgi:hypothetical protein